MPPLLVYQYNYKLQTFPWDPHLRQLRAKSYIATKQDNDAVKDLTYAMKLRSDVTTPSLQLSHLYYTIGDAEHSLR